MSDKIGFFRNAGLYFLGNSLPKVVAFFLLPIYSKYISPEDFGYFDLSQSYIYLIIPVLSLEIYLGMMRFLKESEDRTVLSSIITNGFSFILFFMMVVAASIFLPAFFPQIKYFTLILLLLVVLMLQRYYSSICRGLGKNKLFVLTGMISSFIVVSVNYVLIIYFDMRMESLFYSAIFGFLYQVVHVELSLKIRKYIRLSSFDWKVLKQLLVFSIPLSVGSILYFFLNSYNRFMIENDLGLEANGYFAIAGKFTLFITFLTSAFTMAWQDLSFAPQDEEGRNQRFARGIDLYYKFLMLSGSLLVFFVSFVFPYLIDDQYKDSYTIIALSIGVTLMSSTGDFITQTFLALKKTQIILYTSLAITLLGVVLVPLCVNRLGINGINMALMIVYFLNVVFRLGYLKRAFQFKIDFISVVGFLCYFLFVCWVFEFQNPLYNLIGLIVTGILCFLVFRKEVNQILVKFKVIR